MEHHPVCFADTPPKEGNYISMETRPLGKRKRYLRPSSSGSSKRKWLIWLAVVIIWAFCVRSPVKSGKVTSGYGVRFHGGSTFHYGTDIGLAIGTPVFPVCWGKVRRTGFEARGGNYVYIQHLPGFETRYMHLDSIKVSTGQRVGMKSVIATSGNTGVSTGPHLHYEIRILGVALPPYLLCLPNVIVKKIIGLFSF